MQSGQNIVQIFLSAFLGAFCAFIFFRIGEFLNRVVKRNSLHYSALVKIGRYLNENYEIIHSNNYIIDKIFEQNEKAKTMGVPSFSGNKVNKVFLNEEFLSDLSNIDFLNEIFSYRVDLRNFNADIDSIFSVIKYLQDSHLNKMIDNKTYSFNYDNILYKLGDVRKYNDQLLLVTKELLAKARVLQKQEKTLIQRLYISITKRQYNKKFNNLYQSEVIKVSEEIEIVTKTSKNKLDKIFR